MAARRHPPSHPSRFTLSFTPKARERAAEVAALKVFVGSADKYRKVLIAAASEAQAIELVRAVGLMIDAAHFARFFCETAAEGERVLALAHPRTVFIRTASETELSEYVGYSPESPFQS